MFKFNGIENVMGAESEVLQKLCNAMHVRPLHLLNADFRHRPIKCFYIYLNICKIPEFK